MVSGEAAGGKKRKASVAEDITSPAAARREPRRGLGVAELERIRVALEMAERCYGYAAASSSLSSAAPQHHPPPALPPPATLVVHSAGVAAVPTHHQHVRARHADSMQRQHTLPPSSQALSEI
jgi:hypothetical protein